MVRENPGGEICEIEFVGKEGDYRVVKIVKEHES